MFQNLSSLKFVVTDGCQRFFSPFLTLAGLLLMRVLRVNGKNEEFLTVKYFAAPLGIIFYAKFHIYHKLLDVYTVQMYSTSGENDIKKG